MAPSFLSIMVPVYGEQDNLAELHEEIRKNMEARALRYEVIYVDDVSRDDSWSRLLDLHQRHPGEVRPIRLRRNFGLVRKHGKCPGFPCNSPCKTLLTDKPLC